MEFVFDAQSFKNFGLKLVVEDYGYKKELVVLSQGGSQSLSRLFESDDGFFRFSIGSQKFAIGKKDVILLVEKSEVRYYRQSSLVRLNNDRPTQVASVMKAHS
ncbi:hypothetical protein HF888_16280 (plasmid) [Bermanella marisrubri]|uniref:hypothetical protein n=1 Tax=Bermanella marisrubri TaxID=207949 RepID=UPI001442B1C4|nr:hypothetical protein [Bermanella marisrubri]QIZ85897.1 hypothetical protein HF888_16280 [Bermanella marisrubri]